LQLLPWKQIVVERFVKMGGEIALGEPLEQKLSVQRQLPVVGGIGPPPEPPDTHGLQCKGRLINLDTESGKRIYGAMKERALDGLLIGYTVGEFTRGTKPNEPRRTIKTIKSLPEVPLVTFRIPA
jgi:hypothetical protein